MFCFTLLLGLVFTGVLFLIRFFFHFALGFALVLLLFLFLPSLFFSEGETNLKIRQVQKVLLGRVDGHKDLESFSGRVTM